MSDSENETRKVGQMVGKGNSTLELIYGSLSGMAFGLISPMASQPFDTIKTKMQADARFANQGSVAVGRAVLKTEGLAGLYRGMLPILASTGVQKAALFAGYAGGRRWCEESGISALSQPMPFTGGLSPSVIVGSVASATARTVVETPFELAKVRSQTGGSFKSSQGVFSVAQIAELYTGAFATWARGAVMLCVSPNYHTHTHTLSPFPCWPRPAARLRHRSSRCWHIMSCPARCAGHLSLCFVTTRSAWRPNSCRSRLSVASSRAACVPR